MDRIERYWGARSMILAHMNTLSSYFWLRWTKW